MEDINRHRDRINELMEQHAEDIEKAAEDISSKLQNHYEPLKQGMEVNLTPPPEYAPNPIQDTTPTPEGNGESTSTATTSPWDYYNAMSYANPKQTHSCPNTTPKKKKRHNIKHGNRKRK